MNIVRSCGGRCSVGKVICVMRKTVQHHEIHDYRVSLFWVKVCWFSVFCNWVSNCSQKMRILAQDGDNRLLTVIDEPNSCINSFKMPASNSFAASQSRLPPRLPNLQSISTLLTHKERISTRGLATEFVRFQWIDWRVMNCVCNACVTPPSRALISSSALGDPVVGAIIKAENILRSSDDVCAQPALAKWDWVTHDGRWRGKEKIWVRRWLFILWGDRGAKCQGQCRHGGVGSDSNPS